MTIAIDPTLKRADLCSITLAGNLVQAPEIRYQANPVLAIADITIATHSRWFDKLTNSSVLNANDGTATGCDVDATVVTERCVLRTFKVTQVDPGSRAKQLVG